MKISFNKAKAVSFSLIFFVTLTLGIYKQTAASPQASFLTAVQITDHPLTGEDTGFYGSLLIATGSNAAHVIWREQSATNTGMELFYRSLPNGTTQHLSNNSISNNTSVMFPELQLSMTDTPHVIWEEYTINSVDFRDIYYWNPNDGVTPLVSQTPTTGFNLFRPVVWLEGDDAHIVWKQRNAAQTEDIYMYWNSISKTATELPGFENGVVHNGVLHITWEGTFNGPVNYWNSGDQTITPLPNSTVSGDASANQKGIFVEDSGQISIFFGQSGYSDPAPICLASWNSASQTTTIHVTGNKCFSQAQVQRDSQGVYHTFTVDSNSGFLPYYWNSSLNNPVFFDVSGAGTGYGIPGGELFVSDNGKAHILWQDNNDYFYWNPTDKQIINLSAPFSPNTNLSSDFKFTYLDQNEELAVIWQEQTSSGSAMTPHFWQSAVQTTTNLLTELGMSSIGAQSLNDSSSLDPVYMFYGTPLVGDAGAFYWDIAQDTLTRVWTGLFDGLLFRYKEGLGGEQFTAWVDLSTYTLNVNSTVAGNMVLNQTAASDTGNLGHFIAVDDFGNLYVVWTEMSDIVGEGLDYFAAWPTEFVEVSENLFLPLVTK